MFRQSFNEYLEILKWSENDRLRNNNMFIR